MIKARHWQDPANAVIAVAILVSPWAVGYTSSQQAMANAVIVGAMLFSASVGAAVIGRPWVDCVLAVLGGWMVAAPYELGFARVDAASVTIGFGIVVLALAIWSLLDAVRRPIVPGRSARH